MTLKRSCFLSFAIRASPLSMNAALPCLVVMLSSEPADAVATPNPSTIGASAAIAATRRMMAGFRDRAWPRMPGVVGVFIPYLLGIGDLAERQDPSARSPSTTAGMRGTFHWRLRIVRSQTTQTVAADVPVAGACEGRSRREVAGGIEELRPGYAVSVWRLVVVALVACAFAAAPA